MPRILEMKIIDKAIWAKLTSEGEPMKEPSPIYVWTEQEAKAAKASAIRDFCFALANAYIEGRLDALPSPAPID